MHQTEINGLHVMQDADNQGRTASMQNWDHSSGKKEIAVNMYHNSGMIWVWGSTGNYVL